MNQISVIPIQPVHTSMRMCYVIFYILVDQFGTTDHESHLRTSHRHRPMFILVYWNYCCTVSFIMIFSYVYQGCYYNIYNFTVKPHPLALAMRHSRGKAWGFLRVISTAVAISKGIVRIEMTCMLNLVLATRITQWSMQLYSSTLRTKFSTKFSTCTQYTVPKYMYESAHSVEHCFFICHQVLQIL